MSYLGSDSSEEGGLEPEILPGFKFCPSDEMIVSYYLKKKIQGKDSKFRDLIPEINVREHEPGELPEFFFTRLDPMYIKSDRYNRATEQGYYKKQGKEHKIKAESTKVVIGSKRYLTYYKGHSPNGGKTDYVIHEYSVIHETERGSNPNQQREIVLCWLKKKSANYKSDSKRLEDLDSPFPAPGPPQLGNVPDDYNDECSNCQPPMGDNAVTWAGVLISENNRPTNYGKEPVSNFAYGAPDERISEAEENLGSSFYPFQLEDHTPESPFFNSELLGNFSHANNYIGCDGSEFLDTEIPAFFQQTS